MNIMQILETFNPQLQSLTYEEKLLLGINISKRLYFDYAYFMEDHDCNGDPKLLLDAILAAERGANELPDRKVIAAYHNIVETQADRIEEFIEEFEDDLEDPTLVNCAKEACQALANTLDFMLAGNPDQIRRAVTSMLMSAYNKAGKNDILSEEERDQHPVVVDARSFLLNKAGWSA
ncbi:hypothetical protein HRG84_07725 [Flavisolibacter sp. BT320]|nr:hypothetical protein [Flavisolibacter longurius]